MSLRTLMHAGPTKANALFMKLSETSAGALKIREKLFAELRAELGHHADLKEQHLFPVLKTHADTKEFVAAGLKDNKELRAKLAELEALPKNHEMFLAKVAELRKTFRRHARNEAKELLPAIQKTFGEEQVQGITEKIETSLAEAELAKHDKPENKRAGPCCRDQGCGRGDPRLACVEATRTEFGRPKSSMRFRAWMATSISVARRWSVCERSPSPITCLNLPIVASTRAREV